MARPKTLTVTLALGPADQEVFAAAFPGLPREEWAAALAAWLPEALAERAARHAGKGRRAVKAPKVLSYRDIEGRAADPAGSWAWAAGAAPTDGAGRGLTSKPARAKP